VATAGAVAGGSLLGLPAFKLVDPALVGDIAGDASIDATAVSDLASLTSNLPTPQIPAIPTGLTITPGGPDPTLSLAGGLQDNGIVSVLLDHPHPHGSTGMEEAVLALTYDPKAMTVSSSDITLGSIPGLGSGWVGYTRNIEQKIEELQKHGPADDVPSAELVRVTTAVRTMRWLSRWIKLLINDGKQLAFRLDLDPKTGVVGSEMSLEPRSGSALAKSIGSLRPTKNDFAGIIGADSAAHVLIRAPLFIGDFQETLQKALHFRPKTPKLAPTWLASLKLGPSCPTISARLSWLSWKHRSEWSLLLLTGHSQ
jgi:hypothetical protein